MSAPGFPTGFVWGVATSAYQIEGGRGEEGKGDSIWDRFSDQGRLRDRGDVACDHYHRWEGDLDLMARLGVGAYRFSVAWTRVIPDGDGEVSQAGLDFYRRLVDGMVERGITPYLTLYHWDLPQSLQDRGGWESRATIDAFTRYASVVAAALGGRVGHWITHNEPWVVTMLGHKDGTFAPGIADWRVALAVGHHLLVSHGRATEVIRSEVDGAMVGIALDCRPVHPASDHPADVEAARHFDGYRNRWFLDPVFGRGYPDDMVASYTERDRWDPRVVLPGDQEAIATPIDFLGINYYTTLAMSAGREESEASGVPSGPHPPPGYTEMGWRIDPEGLRRYLEQIHTTYRPSSILITENGASYSDGPDATGRVRDTRRIAYLDAHIRAVEAARGAGVPLDGYFVWSFMDNLEWLEGFSSRFGLVWVDQESGRRLPKDSFHWYAGVASTGTLPGT